MLEIKQSQKNLRVSHSSQSSASDIDSVRLGVYDNWVTLRKEIKLYILFCNQIFNKQLILNCGI